MQNRNKQTQLDVLNKVFDIYENRGFEITSLITDIEFECIRNDIGQIELQTVPADDHVGDIEVSVKLVKEDLRCTVQGLPYKRYPKLMIIEMVADVLRKRNQFPANDGVSDKISPLTIVNGDGPPDFNKMKFEFGAYGQAFQNNSPTNTNTTRSVGAIALSMTPNKYGEYNFMSLNTGRIVDWRKVTPLPITDNVIRRVHELAKHDGQKLIDNGMPSIEWRPGVPVEDVDDEEVVPVYDTPEDEENELIVDDDDEYSVPSQIPDDDDLVQSEDANDDRTKSSSTGSEHNDDEDIDNDEDIDDEVEQHYEKKIVDIDT